MARTTMVLAAVTAGLALAACGGGSDEPSAAGTASEAPAAAQEATVPATSGGGQPPHTETEPAETGAAPPVTDQAQADAEEPREPEATVIRLEGGSPVGGTKTITVKKGAEVRIRVESDVPDEIHLHGYDIELEAAPGKPAIFRFAAEFEGIFELEGHEAAELIAKLVVEP